MYMISGTGCPRSRSHCCISAISSFCALMMRAARVWICGLAPWVGAIRDITIAWAWWPIMSVTNAASAGVKRMRALSVRAR